MPPPARLPGSARARGQAARAGPHPRHGQGADAAQIEGLFATAGDYVDIVKLGWGTSYVTAEPAPSKLALLPLVRRRHGVRRDAARGRRGAGPARRLPRAGCPITASTASRSRTGRSRCPASASSRSSTCSRATSACSRRSARRTPRRCSRPTSGSSGSSEERAAGAWKVITEARESGTAGIFRGSGEVRSGLIDEIAHEIGDRATSSSRRRRRRSRPGSSATSGPTSTSGTSRPRRSSRSRPCASACGSDTMARRARRHPGASAPPRAGLIDLHAHIDGVGRRAVALRARGAGRGAAGRRPRPDGPRHA